MKREQSYFVYGHHSVAAVLQHQPYRGKKLYIARSADVASLKSLADSAGVSYDVIDRAFLEKKFAIGKDAQGLVLVCDAYRYADLTEALLEKCRRILILDTWQDSVNIGRAARAALSFGADLILICKDRSAQITAAAEKAAVGALAQVPVARVVNLAAAISKIKDAGFFVYGADEQGNVAIKNCDFANRVALAIGQEGEGLRDRTKKICDVLVNIPMAHREICLNAADTALIFLYELSTRN